MKEKLKSQKLPEPVGPYSQAIKANGFIFLSGQIGLSREGEIPSSIEEQAEMILQNIKAFLEDKGLSMEAVVKTTIFLTDISDFPRVNEIYASYFKEPYPSRSTVAVKELPKGANVEIEVIVSL